MFLSHVEHVKSIRPSFILTAYLFSTILFDATRARTEWLLDVNREYAGVLTAVIAVKGILLGFETVEKRHSLLDQEKKPSSESTSGPFSRGFFIWLNSLFWSGWSRRLTLHDLPKISEKLNSAMLAERFATKWEQGELAGPFLRSPHHLADYHSRETSQETPSLLCDSRHRQVAPPCDYAAPLSYGWTANISAIPHLPRLEILVQSTQRSKLEPRLWSDRSIFPCLYRVCCKSSSVLVFVRLLTGSRLSEHFTNI